MRPRLYIAGPMSRYPEHNFPAFHSAAAELRKAGFEVCSPAEVKLPCGCAGGLSCSLGEHVWVEYLIADLREMLLKADALALLDGWHNSRGARVEEQLARGLGWPVESVNYWLGEFA